MGKKISVKHLKMNTEALKNRILKERRKNGDKLPSGVAKNFDIDELKVAGCKCYRMRPEGIFNGNYIVYIYGGGMTMNITSEQWEFITKISLRTGAGLFIPMYPLAPESCCREVFDMLQKAYGDFAKSIDIKKLILMGDSYGAGLALSLSMLSWKEGYRKPDQLILLSPVIDTEFFDKELEKQVLENAYKETKYMFSDAVKDFLNTYWVKDYAVKTEYTSPYYEDFTDLCDDVVLFSGEEDMFNCYARAFYNKAKKQGVNIRFFEFEGEQHNFLLHSKSQEQKNAYGYLIDVLCGTYNNSLRDLYPLKMISDWTKKYPEILHDDWASKFIYDNHFDFSKVKTRFGEYRNIIQASNYASCDSVVRQYILKFPNCTIVHVGCRLGDMFERVDNGRIQWYSIDTHNMMSVRRSMYGKKDRERTVGRSLMDFSWIDDISCNRNQGIMFVFNESLTFLSLPQVKKMIDRIWEKFPGCEIVFTASTAGSTFLYNLRYKNTIVQKRKKMSINDAQKTMSSWRTDYRILAEEPVMKFFKGQKGLKLLTKLGIKYNLITYNHKIIHVKLGSEVYEIKV